MKLTENQQRAIDTSGNVIVSASAGSGKTTVLIGRVMRLLKEGKSLQNMLICTFTRASAADMRAKLYESLSAVASDDAHLKSEIEELAYADIGTLHSWCRSIVRTYFFAAQFDPTATVMEENDSRSALLSCVAAAIENPPTENAVRLVEIFGERQLTDCVKNIAEFALSMPNPLQWLTLENAKEQARNHIENELTEKHAKLEEAFADLRLNAEQAKAADLLPFIDELKLYFDGKLCKLSAFRMKDKATFAKLCADFERLRVRVKSYLETVEAIAECEKVDASRERDGWIDLSSYAIELYEKKKQRENRIDFSDLEHGAYRALCDDKCRAKIRERYRYIFIDEFQDINPMQNLIAEKLREGEGGETFLVGDFKQSIYSFRHCDPTFFAQALQSREFTRVDLNDNFRSGKNVLASVNSVFNACMTIEHGVDYKGEAQLTGGTDGGTARFVRIQEGEERVEQGVYDITAENAKPDAEGMFLTKCILDAIEDGAEWSQIAVLSFSRTPLRRFAQVFRSYGIPCRLVDSLDINDSDALKPLLNVLSAIDNRRDDIPLYGAMRSPLGNFTDGELLQVSRCGEKFSDAVFGLASRAIDEVAATSNGSRGKGAACIVSADLEKRVGEFVARLDRLTEYASGHNAIEICDRVVSECGFFPNAYASDDSEAANILNAFLNFVSTFAYGSSLSEFLSSLDGAKTAFETSGDCVTLMTVHGSKGLEFDHVFVAGLGTKFNTDDLKRTAICSERWGVCAKSADESSRSFNDSIEYKGAKDALAGKLEDEWIRLLYVALTRAKRHLTVSATYGEIKEKDKRAVVPFEFITNVPIEIIEEANCMLPPPCKVEKVSVSVDKKIYNAAAKVLDEQKKNECGAFKTCVTKIAEKEEDDPATDYEVSEYFGDNDGADATERGNAYHKAMELIALDGSNLAQVKEQLERLFPDVTVDYDCILRAAAHMRALVGNRKLYREQPFIMGIDRARVKEVGSGKILLQGVIDALITDGKTVEIIDYKTSRDSSMFSAQYKKQLELYAESAQQSLKLPVTALRLYSFRTNAFVTVRGEPTDNEMKR